MTLLRFAGIVGPLICIPIFGATHVPQPFIPVKATTAEVRFYNREMKLGAFLLPEQILAAEKPVLASPIRLVAEPDVLSVVHGTGKLIERTGARAVWDWTGESAAFLITSKATADYDGFCWYDIELKPKRSVKLRSLALEIPRRAATARYLHTASWDWSNVSEGLPEHGGKWADKFTPYVWLGDEERGLAWCAESDEGWSVKQSNPISVETKGDVVLFKAALLDHEETISKPIRLRFGLQASPVKPISTEWRANARILHDIHYESAVKGADGKCELDKLRDGGAKTVVIHDSWTKFFGQMIPADDAKFRQLIDACHERGLKLLVYVGYGIARNAPEIQGKHAEWSVLPLIPWDPGYKPETRGFDATCPNSLWANWLVDGTDKLFSTYKLDGLYFDGTTAAWRCENQEHGCGWKDAQGNVHTVFPVLAARDLMRRIADTVHRYNPNAILDAHMSSNLTLPTVDFCDSLWNGEQFEGMPGAQFSVPLHRFRTEFMGYAHGMDMEFLCYENRPFTFEESIALAWLHGIEVRPYPGNLHYVTPLWNAFDRFGYTKAKWRPYWSETGVRTDSESAKVSVWSRNDRALLFVSHLERKAATISVTIDAAKLGLANGVKAKDALSSTKIEVNGGKVQLPFAGMSFRLIEVSNE